MQTTIHPISGEELMAYLDGEMPGERALVVQNHLDTCRECQSLAADFQAVARQLSDWQVDEASFAPALPRQAKSRGVLKRFSIRSLWIWAPAAVAATLLLLVLYRPKPLVKAVHPHVEYLSDYKAQSRSQGTIGRLPAKQFLQSDAGLAPGPMIVRTGELRLTVRTFEPARDTVQRIVSQHSGYIAELSSSTQAGQARSLHASLRVPAAQFDGLLSALRELGHVTYESQRGEDVNKQFVDLNARLNNARNTEQRLTELLRSRTGKLADVLAVEEQLDNVRGRIESMEAEVKNMSSQVAFSSVNLIVTEEYNVPLSEIGNPSAGTRLRNAAVEGYHNLGGAVVGFLSLLLSAGPVILLAAAVLFVPVRLLWRKAKSRVD